MKRTIRLACLFAMVALAPTLALVPTLALAHQHPNAGASRPDDELGWAIYREGNWHVSEIWNRDAIEKLPSKYGDDFLYIRDGVNEYVITDPDLVERAAHAQRQIKMHTVQINALANAAAELAMSRVNGTWERHRLEKAEFKLEGVIERGKKHGDDTRQAERDLKLVREQLARLEAGGGEALTETERQELIERRDQASKELDKAVAGIRKEIRVILHEAIEKDLAEPIR